MVGTGRAPSMEDKRRMPYTNATIHELQRLHKIHMENFPRMATQDIMFRGHTIPKVMLWPWTLSDPKGRSGRGA